MPVVPHTTDTPVVKQFAFDGQWIPDLDPSKIGENNFATLRNFRYIDGGIAPIEGYTGLTTNIVNATYRFPAEGIQLTSPHGDLEVVFCWDVDELNSRIYYRDVAAPAAGDFETASIYTPDSTYQQDPAFGKLPRGIGYSNEYESVIWEGPTALPGAVFTCEAITALAATNPINNTSRVRNQYVTAHELMTVNSDFNYVLIGSTRPMDSWTPTIQTANAAASVCSGWEWTTTGWSALTITDGTSAGVASLATSGGTISWAENTTTTCVPGYFEGTYLYLYLFLFTGSVSATISYITVNMRMQTIKDVWDGVYRTCIACEVKNGDGLQPNDYLLEVNEPSDSDYPVAAILDNIGTDGSDYLEVAFEERTAGILLEVIAGEENTTTEYFTVYYWDGTGYTAVSNQNDGTSAGGTPGSLNKTGVLSWQPPDIGSERIRNRQGAIGYFYRLIPTAAFSASVKIDLISGIPAPRTLGGHKFCGTYGQRPFWGGDVYGLEPNSLDYGPPNTVDVYNGQESSDRGQRIYVGDQAELTGLATIYNRFGSSIYETMLIFKDASTHLLYGTGPADYRLYNISQSYGCPARKTIATAEVGYDMGGGAFRNICIWMSYRGPVLFDGATMIPMTGVDLYFDPRKTDTYINTTYIRDSVGWFDPFWKEYHLLIPTGTSTKLNTHIVYDLARRRWFEIYYDGGVNDRPQHGFNVRDANGATYTYVMRDDGHLLRFGYGTDWDGNDLVHRVRTGDFFVGDSIWVRSKMQELRIGHELPDFDPDTTYLTIGVNYYRDGAETAVALDDFTMQRSDHLEEINLLTEDGDEILTEAGDFLTFNWLNAKRYVTKTQSIDKAALTHQFEFYRTSTSLSFLGNFGKNLIWWGFLARPEGLDTR